MRTKRPKTGYDKNLLRNLRETKLFINQQRAAELIGINRVIYNQIELGRCRPAVKWIPRIAEVFQISSDVLCQIYGLGEHRS